ncbi:MAG: DoxX family protein, partial [Deinococcota bacterium]|nr:DoxX family protein [Deinococcota bacterium]
MTTISKKELTDDVNTPSSPLQRLGVGLAILRLALGTVFVAHGAQKFFEFGLAGTIGAFSQMGIPLAGIAAPLVMALELVGALLLMGLLTRFV